VFKGMSPRPKDDGKVCSPIPFPDWQRGVNVQIVPFTRGMCAEASRVLAGAFVGNPLHVAAFGASRFDRNYRFFRMGLSAMKGAKWVATDGSRILGVVHWVHWPHCRASATETLRTSPTMVVAFGWGSTRRLVTWLSAWTEIDPATPHSHLGPIGVAPEVQGCGVGRRLMEKFCAELDDRRALGYLETDRAENVEFYRRFGFEVIGHAEVLGVPHVLMSRS